MTKEEHKRLEEYTNNLYKHRQKDRKAKKEGGASNGSQDKDIQN